MSCRMVWFPISILCFLSMHTDASAQDAGSGLSIARLKYGGGGDWYSNASSLPNLLAALRERLEMTFPKQESVVAPSDPALAGYPILYMNGHGTVRFTEAERERLRDYLHRGGFLWADDNYGMDSSFRSEMQQLFPDHPLVELPHDHPIYHYFYSFDAGPPKIHLHDGLPAQGLGIYLDGRLVVFYTYQCDIGDGMESQGVHPEDPPEKHEAALQMGINIVLFALSS
ncbi:MAG TPA: DUF4159 domain-containing protein [bacterium]|nr:DUF4159 domain-containing protein [bacterium]